MPGPVIPAGAAQVLVAFRGVGGQGPFVATYGITGGGYTVAKANALKEIWRNRWIVGVPSAMSLTDVQLWVGPSGSITTVSSTTGPSAGGSANTALPPNCSTVVRKHTATAGRRGRGRMHLPGALEQNVDAWGVVSAAAIVTYNGRLASILADHVAAGAPMQLLHSSGSTVPTPITLLDVSTKVGTLRKRLA